MAYFVVVAILDRRGDKVACRVARVERREAQRLSPQARAALARLRKVDRSQGSPQGVSQTPGASRRSITPFYTGNGRMPEMRYPCLAKLARDLRGESKELWG